jgi:hypothetical protein
MLFLSRFSFFALLIVGWSCKTIQPEAPKELVDDHALPNEVSELIIPIEIPVATLQSQINKQLTGLLYEDNSMEGDNLEVKVWKLGDIRLAASGNSIQYKVPLKIWLKTALKLGTLGFDFGTIKETEFALELSFRSRINIDQNWNLESITSSDGYTWIQKPSVELAGMSVPITAIADRIIKGQLKLFANMIDEEAKPYLDIKGDIETLWKRMHDPVLVSEDPELWLKVSPLELSISSLRGDKEKLSVLMGIACKANTRMGSKPITTYSDLPKLKLNNYTGSYFNVSVLSSLTYAKATELASAELVGQKFTFGSKGKKHITVNKIHIYPSGDRLVTKLEVEGSISGNIYLSGVPFFDRETEKLYLNDFDYDLDTKNKILKSANWLAHGTFAKRLSKYFEYDLSPTLTDGRLAVKEAIENRQLFDRVQLSGRLDHLYPTSIFLSKGSVNAIISGQGKLEVKVTSF